MGFKMLGQLAQQVQKENIHLMLDIFLQDGNMRMKRDSLEWWVNSNERTVSCCFVIENKHDNFELSDFTFKFSIDENRKARVEVTGRNMVKWNLRPQGERGKMFEAVYTAADFIVEKANGPDTVPQVRGEQV